MDQNIVLIKYFSIVRAHTHIYTYIFLVTGQNSKKQTK